MVPGEIDILPEYREVTGTPRGLMGLHGTRGRRGKEPGGGRAPLPFLVQIGQGKGGGAPPFLPLFLLFPPFSYSYLERREGEVGRPYGALQEEESY